MGVENSSFQKQKEDFLAFVEKSHRITFQERRQLLEMAGDLLQWSQNPFDLWPTDCEVKTTGKAAFRSLFNHFQENYQRYRSQEKRYGQPPSWESRPVRCLRENRQNRIVGRCPVYSPKTRCCGLHTLDAVMRCGYDCSYCSIQSFYHDDTVIFSSNLKEQLSQWEKEIDPHQWIHVGTGQSSDSLMWGNREGLLEDLFDLARRQPRLLLELKTKSDRWQDLCQLSVPPNVFATWSLNTPTIIAHEERLTASLSKRLEAARRVADKGIPVGFHFHPMVYYHGWQQEYREVVQQLLSLFEPKEVICISLGTLTFIKPVLQQIRKRGAATKILQMEMEEIAGKFSYPYERKKELFRELYSFFPEQWRRGVFFYLCMEDERLWKDVFGYEYLTNEAFEEAMVSAYRKKLWGREV